MTKVHCKNCDAVVEAEEQRHYVGFNVYLARCHYCNSVETEKTEEPLRGPKWERSVDDFQTTSAADRQWDQNAFGSSMQ